LYQNGEELSIHRWQVLRKNSESFLLSLFLLLSF
jgi:hypothetical protein